MFDDIRAKMNDWEAPAPEGLWDSIEAAMKADRERSMQPVRTGRMKNAGRKSRLRTVYAMATAAAAVLLLLLLLPERPHTTEGTGSPSWRKTIQSCLRAQRKIPMAQASRETELPGTEQEIQFTILSGTSPQRQEQRQGPERKEWHWTIPDLT